MKRIAAAIAFGGMLAAACTPARAQSSAASIPAPASTSASRAGGTLLQFDQLRMPVPAGQPLPPPDAFEQQYASAEQLLKSDSLQQIQQASAELRSKLPKPGSTDHAMARANIEGTGEMAEGLVLSRVPVVGMVVETVQGGITSAIRKKHSEHELQAFQQYSQQIMSLYQRPQLLHVSAWDDRLRVNNADTGEITLVQPDRQRLVVLTPSDKTYTIQPLTGVPFSQFSCDAAPENVAALGPTRIADVPVQGYRYKEPGKSPDGSAMVVTVTLYVSEYTLPLASMNPLQGTDCAEDSASVRNAPGGAEHLVVYASYAHQADSAATQGMPPGLAAMLSPQSVLWRGHLHTAPANPELFGIPADYKPAPPVSLPVPPATTAATH